jgi:hypothetical protein
LKTKSVLSHAGINGKTPETRGFSLTKERTGDIVKIGKLIVKEKTEKKGKKIKNYRYPPTYQLF